jgi:hypothetical protein
MSELAAELESLDSQQVRCFAASCASYFTPAWSRWAERNALPFLIATEELLWAAVSKPDVARLRQAAKELKQIPILADHNTENPAVQFTQKGLLVMGYAILVAQNPTELQKRLHLHFQSSGLCRELDAYVTPQRFGGRKTRAVREPETLRMERAELERQRSLCAELRATDDLKKFASLWRERLAEDPQRKLIIQALGQIPFI